MSNSNAAQNLEGRILKTGWKVINKIEKPEYATGQFFSVCYLVEKDDQICFLKAFDFAKFFQIQPASIVDVMTDMLNAYKYEKDLSDLCLNNHVTKVVFVKDSGEEEVEGFSIPTVPYLIFDLADGDVRQRLKVSGKLDFVWRLKSLHDIAVGLKQLHSINVSHQDLKPSNILLFDMDSKIGDLGRSVCDKLVGPHSSLKFAGDYNYAPPEVMYNYYEADWIKRVFATDCYLLGSMIVFYFTNVTMSALLMKHIPENFRWHVWRGTFDEIKPYIADAFTKSLNDFELALDDDQFKFELKQLVEKLCYPFPENRGHPKNILSKGNSYNLERFISKFDLLHKRALYSLKN
jgi:serine/threonine protein kinase